MKKRFLLLMAMVASSAWAQQNTDISAEQFNSGSANAQLSALGRQAASSGKRLVVTAPQHWHAQIAAKIRAGGNADVVLKDGFYETVLVRIEEKVEEPAKPEPKPDPVVRAEPKRVAEPPRVEPAPAPRAEELPVAPPARSVVEAPRPAPAPAPEIQVPPPAATPPPAQPAVSAPAQVAEQAATTMATDSAPASDPATPALLVVSEPGDTDAVRISLEKRYNEGKRITERVEVPGLRRADVIYTGNGAAVVVRREGSRLLRMWLIGSLNLDQIGISSDGANKYQVLNGTIK